MSWTPGRARYFVDPSVPRLRPFFSFFGSKWNSIKRYPRPTHQLIVEPFAGSASYALHYPGLRVVLNDADPVIFGIWNYLIRARESEVLNLPVDFESVESLTIPQEARWLIGFWLNRQNNHPCVSPSAWMREGIYPNSFWGVGKRQRIADQLQHIRHWKVTGNSYQDCQVGASASWFIDPPYYQTSGRAYSMQVGCYNELAAWCRAREGQVIVCEQEGSDWLPFEYLGVLRSVQKKKSNEVVWVNGC